MFEESDEQSVEAVGWGCRALQAGDFANDQAAFAKRLEELIGQGDYRATGINDHTRFERHVRSQLRKVAKMTKANMRSSRRRRAVSERRRSIESGRSSGLQGHRCCPLADTKASRPFSPDNFSTALNTANSASVG